MSDKDDHRQPSIKVYRSLDRPLSFFGIKGRFMLVVAVLGGAALLLGFIVGAAAGSTILGSVVVLGGVAAGVAVTTILQDKYTERDFFKMLDSRNIRSCVRFSGYSVNGLLRREADAQERDSER